MTAWIIRRVLLASVITVAVVAGVFLLVNAVGDPAVATLGPNAGPEQIRDFERSQGLDQSLAVQFGSYVGLLPCARPASPRYARGQRCGLLQGDFGQSFSHDEPVGAVIAKRLPRTLLLGAVAMFFELLFGLGVGILAAVRRNTYIDTGLMSIAFLGISLPTFVTGPLFLAAFAFRYGWFPLGGYGVDFMNHLHHAILPALTLAILGAATYARVMRSELVDTLRSDFVRTAAAKGLPPRRVVAHAVRNALLPVVTLFGLSLPLLVAGAIITEKIFGWPGMGSLAIESIINLDAPTVMGVVVVFAVTVQVGNLFADIAIALLDPRVRLERG